MLDDAKEYIEEMMKEMDSWNLNRDNLTKFDAFLNTIILTNGSFAKTVSYNRYFCPVCATKLLAEKTVDATPIIEYLATIRHVNSREADFSYFLRELYFNFYICEMLNEIGPAYLIKHLKDYVVLKYKKLTKDAAEKIYNLKITSLAFNAMISEIMDRLLDIAFYFVSSMKLEKDIERKVLMFIIERIMYFVGNYSILYDDSKEAISIIVNKFKPELFKELETNDPLIIVKDLSK